MQTYSESESDRTVLAFRGPDGQAATVIVMRRHSRVWLVFDGAIKTTAAMTDPQATELITAVRAASRGRDEQRCCGAGQHVPPTPHLVCEAWGPDDGVVVAPPPRFPHPSHSTPSPVTASPSLFLEVALFLEIVD